MHKSNEDCFYFLTSSCAKGSSCTYRHSPLALTCNVICPSWSHGNCPDPACPYRHSSVQRPMVSNGILCFYENTPMGCLKPDCTFIHSRPRMNLRNTPPTRPASTNLINQDSTKPILTNTPSTDIPQPTLVSGPNTNAPQHTNNEIQTTIPTTATIEPLPTSDKSSPVVKTEIIIPRRIAVPSDIEQTNEKKNLSDNNTNNSSLIKSTCTTRSVITDSPKRNEEEIKTTQPRLVVNRNVVIADTNSVSNRKVVQTAPPSSSNRVVVSSGSINSPSKGKKKDVDLIEQENNTKKFKRDSQSTIDIPFPCSSPSITNRLLLASSKETISTNDPKPIRLNRDRLPATTTLSGNSPVSVSSPSNEEKTSAGTGLSQDDERRTMRLQRFQQQPISPPRSVVCSSITTTNSINSSDTGNVTKSSPNERKRTAPETITKDVPLPKRVSTSLSTSSIRDKHREKQADEFTAKGVQRENSSSKPTVPHQSVLPSSTRPRFTPQPIVPPSLQQPSTSSTRTSRLRQPPSVAIKRSLASVIVPSQTSTKRSEQVSSNTTGNNAAAPSPKPTVERQTASILNEEDENQLLKLNETTDVVDTFALIDEALLEADHLLELM